jgi:hypothetical protein
MIRLPKEAPMPQETGTETTWDSAHREGGAQMLEHTLGISYRRAWLLARDHWQFSNTWRVRLARWLLRKELP